MERLGYFDCIVPSCLCIVTKQHGVRGGKYFLKSPGNVISETLNFEIFLDASALKNLCLCASSAYYSLSACHVSPSLQSRQLNLSKESADFREVTLYL